MASSLDVAVFFIKSCIDPLSGFGTESDNSTTILLDAAVPPFTMLNFTLK